MSFPSALSRIENGDSPEEALLFAIKNDTNLGFAALQAMAEAFKKKIDDPILHIKNRVGSEHATDVLYSEKFGVALKIDFNPLSQLGAQIARLLGTDAARPLMESHLGVTFAFANCCAPIVGDKPMDVKFTPADQIRWQVNINC